MKQLLLLCLLASGLQAQTLVSGGVLSSDTTWDLAGSPYIVQGTVLVYGSSAPVLTIEAGVEVRFEEETVLHVGYHTGLHPAYVGGLDVQGTALDPVLFTTDNGLAGGWQGINFNDPSDYLGSSSTLAHCVIEKAVRCITVYNSDHPVMQDVELNEASEYPMHLSGAALLSLSNVSIAGNGEDRVLYDGVIADSLTLDTVSWPLPLVFGDLSIYGSDAPQVMVAPGSELRFLSGSTLNVGRNIQNESSAHAGSLVAQGKAGMPITFRPDDDSIGGWNGLRFNNSSDYGGSVSLLEYCVVEKAVRNIHVLESDSPLLENVELNDAGEWPLYLDACGLPANTGLSASGNPENRAY